MSGKIKFHKLRLPRERSTKTTQISKFFIPSCSDEISNSGSTTENKIFSSNSCSNSPESKKLKSCSSFEMDDISLSSNTESHGTNLEILSFADKSPEKGTKGPDLTFSENDFIPSNSQKPSKRVPAQPRKTRKRTKNESNQPKIKNALKDKQKSENMKRRSITDGGNPDETRIALALSAFEASKNAYVSKQLGKFNFDPCGGRGEVTELFPIYTKRRGKVFNKFTALTMRNADKQQEKLARNVEKLLTDDLVVPQECVLSETDIDIILVSDLLKSVRAKTLMTSIQSENLKEIENYFVLGLFQPRHVQMGCLLKDFRKIPGRSISPEPLLKESKNLKTNEKLHILNAKKPLNIIEVEDVDDKNEKEFKAEITCNLYVADQKLSREPSPDMFSEFEMEPEKEEIRESSHSEIENKCLRKEYETEFFQPINNQNLECNENGVTIYETYTSDEGKNVEKLQCEVNSFIDLTEDDDENNIAAEIRFTQSSCGESIKANNLSQRSDMSTNSSCIILSDDEVNYSIRKADETLRKLKRIVREECGTLTRKRINLGEQDDEFTLSSLKANAHYDSSLPRSLTQDSDSGQEIISLSSYSAKNLKNETSIDHEIDKFKILSNQFIDCENDELHENSETDDVDEFNLSNKDDILENINENIDPDMQIYNPNQSLLELIGVEEQDNLNLIANDFLEKDVLMSQKSHTETLELPDSDSEEWRDPVLLALDSLKRKPAFSKSTCSSVFKTPEIIDKHLGILNYDKVAYSSSPKSRRLSEFRKIYSDSTLGNITSMCNDKIRRNSSAKKFKSFIEDEMNYSDLDEIDKLVYGNHTPNDNFKFPTGMEKLLTGTIEKTNDSDVEEFICDQIKYKVRKKNIPLKPNYKTMDSEDLRQELAKYGLKPLKRKQAGIMLEHIYNQMHPIIADCIGNQKDDCSSNDRMNRNRSLPSLELCDEFNALPTDSTNQASIQHFFRSTWNNLLKSNLQIEDAVLNSKPVDLDEILSLCVQLGSEYNMKQVKTFLEDQGIPYIDVHISEGDIKDNDNECIDLTQSGADTDECSDDACYNSNNKNNSSIPSISYEKKSIETISLSDDDQDDNLKQQNSVLQNLLQPVGKECITIEGENMDLNVQECHNISVLDIINCDSNSNDFPFENASNQTYKNEKDNKKDEVSNSKSVLVEHDCGKIRNDASREDHTSFLDVIAEDACSSDFDEIDKLVYKGLSSKKFAFNEILDADKPIVLDDQQETKNYSEFIQDNVKYRVRSTNVSSKPNFGEMDTNALQNELDKYGMKPLKKKQAIMMLEYIYNQTHPIVLDSQIECPVEDRVDCINENERSVRDTITHNVLTTSVKNDTYKLKDCSGECLVKDEGISPEIANEIYIFPTNSRKKIATCQLPFHIAWYNLVKSNLNLREAIICYEPIDLKEVYLFLKSIGYRYEPKDIKQFFDKRCIIFRYDLGDSTKNRHVRKTNRQCTQKSSQR